MAKTTFTLLDPEKVAADPADALVIASNALAALSLAVERIRVEDLDIASASGFRNLFDAIRGTMDMATEEVRVMMAVDEAGISLMVNSNQCREARTLLGWSQKELGARYGIGDEHKISAFERGARLHGSSRKRLAKIFEAAGVQFLPDGTVQLRAPVIAGEE